LTTINETVEQSLASAGYGTYMSYARPVVAALVNREQEICGHLIRFGTEQGLAENQVRDLLSNIGMEVPIPETEPDAEPEDDVSSVLSRIEQSLAGLTQFARDNGYTG
jgi:hypothetical protein